MYFTIDGNPKDGILSIRELNTGWVDYSDFQPRSDVAAVEFAVSAFEDFCQDYFIEKA